MTKKLKDAHGLTMVEMLCAVLILVLLCLLVNTGMHMAVQSYRDVTAEAEARLLLNSLSNALCDKLRYAVMTRDDAGPYEYEDPDGNKCKYSCSIGNIMKAAGETGTNAEKNGKLVVGSDKKLLLPIGAYRNDKYEISAIDISVSDVSDDVATFKVTLGVQEKTSGVTSAETALTVRCLTPIREE